MGKIAALPALSSLSSAFTAISAVTSVIGGIQSMQESKSQASAERAATEARVRQEARDSIEMEKRQKLAYLSSGVTLEGSPLLTLAETRDRASQNAQVISTEGAARESAIRSSGREALFGGLTGGIKKASEMDIFQPKGK